MGRTLMRPSIRSSQALARAWLVLDAPTAVAVGASVRRRRGWSARREVVDSAMSAAVSAFGLGGGGVAAERQSARSRPLLGELRRRPGR